MNEFHAEQEPSPWEAAVINPNPAIGQTPPAPGWELFSQERLAAEAPELLARWEENVERNFYAPDGLITDEVETTSQHTDTTVEAPEGEDRRELPPAERIAAIGQIAIASPGQPNIGKHRAKKRYEDMSTLRKITHVVGIGTAITVMAIPCAGDTSSPELYSPPSFQYADIDAKSCPPGTTIGAFNVNGFGDNMIGVYSARQEQGFLPEQKDVCFAGLIFGTDLDAPGNASALHEYIDKNKLKKVIIFAFSFGGMATIDMLNEYHRQHPESDVDFSVVFVSAPADYDDLQDDQKSAVQAFSVGALDAGSVKLITYLSIVQQGDKNPISQQVTDDTNVAAANTPPRLIWEESLRILLGMSKSDMDVAAFAVFDYNDKVVKMPQAIQTIVDRSGLSFIQIVPMEHTDHRMNNHAAAWWPANNDDYRGPFTTVIEASRNEFKRKEAMRILAQCAVHGKVLVRVAC